MIWNRLLLKYAMICSIALGATSSFIYAQVEFPDELTNGGLEQWAGENRPIGWMFGSQKGGVLSRESEDVLEGERSARIDTTVSKQGRGDFSNLSMRLEGQPFRGKRVRFRAAVRIDEITDGGRAQLWFRVDRESEKPLAGAFDNMQDRPITGSQWDHYEIVLDVDEDADKIIVGLLCLGKSKIWFDDASFEVVGDDVPTTGKSSNQTTAEGDQKQPPRSGMSPVLMKALAEADNAPRQPFFTPWLWLVVIAIGLFAVSGLGSSVAKVPPGVVAEGSKAGLAFSGFVAGFAFRFSLVYWLVYNFPIPLSSLIPKYGAMFQAWYTAKMSAFVSWIAGNVFKIPGELVPPNGSGDTTFSYIQVFTFFVIAIAVASLWTLIDRRKTDYRISRDLLRSYLRYVLAFWMLSYGLAKVSWGSNQFPVISEWQFNKNWGDSSPMNVVWSFMGTSRAYTVFAGLGEVVGGLLIIWRRTSTLGAMVIFGVMLNVMMLNFCYDVPVKLFSAHLLIMAMYVLLADSKRLTSILLFNRNTEKVDIRPPYTGPTTIWIQRVVKLAMVTFIVAIPIFKHLKAEIGYFSAQAGVPEYFGQYEIEEFRIDGKIVDQTDDEYGWRSVRFLRQNDYTVSGVALKDKITIGFNQAVGRVSAGFTDEQGDMNLEMEAHANQMIPKDTIELEQSDEDRLILRGQTGSGEIEVTLRRNDNIYRVKDRGFRWINEVPFNR